MNIIEETTKQPFIEYAEKPLIRETPEYKTMDAYNAVGIIEGFVEADNEAEIAAAWQFAYDAPGVASILHGSLNQNFDWMIEEGLIEA